jgi:hypothetical protein
MEAYYLEKNEYLAYMIGLFFIYVILWYITLNGWMPSSFLTPIGQLLGLCALIITAIFVVNQLRGE